ncbi:MAG: TonB-dependent receptor [Chitinophagaceae bacterium]|nr:MAG: TonB-dependent receptor [Chitinophagaceae bacterium]
MERKLILSLLACFCSVLAWAQTRNVSGRVISDSATNGLGGVSVTVKGTQTSTSTNAEGRYTITIPNRNNVVLEFSSVGYRRQEVAVGNRTTVDVSLAEEVSALNDIVVIGYGTSRRKDLSGTIASIGAKELEKIPVANAAEAITGRLPGVQVTTVDGAPGAEIVIRVRGGGSLTGDNSPLYIVDGFRVNSINDIAPSDIASIDILKDAATSAIYGAAGANGVVIITTKNARGGRTTINYNGFVQQRNLPRKLEVLSPYEFVLAQYEYARLRSQTDVDNFSRYFGVYDDLELYKNQQGTDWQKSLFGNPVYSQQHNFSVTGGTEKTRMALTFTNNKDQGLVPGSAYQRNYLNFKLNHEVSKALRFDFASRYTHTIIDGAGTSGGSSLRVGDGITTRPVNGIADMIIVDPGSGDDYDQFLRNLINPIQLAAQDYRKRTNRVLNMNIAASWNIVKDLTYRSEFGYDLGWGNNRRYFGPLTSTSRNEGGNLPMGEISQFNTNGYRWTNTLNYRLRSNSKHDLNFLVGQEMLALGQGFEEYNRAKYFAENITPQKLFATMTLGTQDRHTTNEFAGNKIASFFGRAIYQLNDKYIFNLTARYDGSTKFAPGKQWGLFPAASFAWRVSSEDFMQNATFVNDLKLRLSYGTAGNNNIGNDQWRVLFSPTDNRPIGFGDVAQPYYTFSGNQLPNPDIRWETTITRNIGLDFTLFRNRLTGTLDFYKNTTKDLLVQSVIPQTTGFTTQQRNIGQTSNRGIELALNGTIISGKDFQLSASFNVGINRARIDALDGVNEQSFNSNWAGTDLKTIDDYRLIVGRTIGLMYGYVTDGMYTVDDFESYNASNGRYTLKPGVANVGSLLGGISLRPGVLKLKDLDNDGAITAADREIIGSALPKATGGFGVNSAYKGFDLSAFFNWVYGNDVYNTGKISYNMLYRTTYGNMLTTSDYENRFHYIDRQGNLVTELDELRKLNPNPTIWSPFSMGTASPVFHSWAVEDGSFLRLNNLSLGYTLPVKLTSKASISKLRVYVTAYNAFLWTKYSGYDPEVSTTRSSSYSQLTPGVDYSAYPKSRTFTAGVNVTF